MLPCRRNRLPATQYRGRTIPDVESLSPRRRRRARPRRGWAVFDEISYFWYRESITIKTRFTRPMDTDDRPSRSDPQRDAAPNAPLVAVELFSSRATPFLRVAGNRDKMAGRGASSRLVRNFIRLSFVSEPRFILVSSSKSQTKEGERRKETNSITVSQRGAELERRRN